MKWSYQIGTVLGFPVRVHLSLLFFLVFIMLTGGGVVGLVLMVAVFTSVLAHELGHAVVARSKGLPISDISLYPFGGMARMTAPPRTSRDEIQVAVAGPATSLALGLLFSVLYWLTHHFAWWSLAEVNILLGSFNLLPALPMDGGRIFRALLARRQGFYHATASAARLSRWICLGLMVVGIVYSGWLVVLAAFLLLMSMAEEGNARVRRFMGDPGYQDLPSGEPQGTRVPSTEWEVLPPERPDGGNGPHSSTRIYTDRHGNRIVIEWRDGH